MAGNFVRIGALLLVFFATPAHASDTAWFRILAENGKQMGYFRQDVEKASEGRRIIERSSIRIAEAGNAIKTLTERKIRTEDAQGRTTLIESESIAGSVKTQVRVRIEGKVAHVDHISRHGTRSLLVPLPDGVRFDNGAGLMPLWAAQPSPSLEFLAFNTASDSVERVTLERQPGFDQDPEGRLFLIRKSWDGDRLRGVSTQVLARDTTLLRSTQWTLGTTVTLERSPTDASLKPGSAVSIVRAAMVKSPFRIAPDAMGGHIRFTFGYKDGLAFPVPQTGEQRVRRDGDSIVIDVCETCGPAQPLPPEDRAQALASTRWLESDAPALHAIGEAIGAQPVSDAEKMNLLAVRARQHMRKMDFSGHYTALEAFTRRAGDCTEEASILAALGRAAGIPTRTAHGLVYSREAYHGISNVFMPHSWTLAWIDGRWQSFDMSLGTFDATHIVLTIGDGDARSVSAAGQLAARLDWQGMTQVKARKAE